MNMKLDAWTYLLTEAEETETHKKKKKKKKKQEEEEAEMEEEEAVAGPAEVVRSENCHVWSPL